MQQLTPKFEYKNFQELSRTGITTIVGIDEVGRGSWAGPLVMAAYAINFSTRPTLKSHRRIANVNDSKQLTRKRREEIHKQLLLEQIKNHSTIVTAEITAQTISEKGLAWGVHTALEQLLLSFTPETTLFLLDGGLKPKLSVNYQTIIKGDAQIYSIALAAIYAKVYRDSLLRELHKQYPLYGFSTNVGYATKQHREAILKHGITPEHRLSYKPLQVFTLQPQN